jgi:D-serine deaminase-like pyridoxal phosphate-dependent protein
MPVDRLAALARAIGRGEPVLLLDLAALDHNTAVVVDFANRQRWAVRPALKSFRSPQLTSYLLRRLPRPRGLVFNLAEVDPIVAAAPRGTDLMLGYPPTVGELGAFLARRAPRGQRAYRLRILVDSVPLMEELARLARRTPRRLPLDVALELDVGMGRGGINDPSELRGCLDVLRAERRRLRLGAVLGYDGHATLTGTRAYRQIVAAQAQSAYRRHLTALRGLGEDLYDERTLIRNGPGSSNYRNWPGGPINEISPGSAFLLAGYLSGGYDTDGLTPALAACGAVRRITGDHPSLPLTGTTLPRSNSEEIIVQGVGDAGELAHPPGASGDELSGGGDALAVPKGAVALGDYVVFRPTQTEVGIQRFNAIVAVREGRVRRRWAVQPRPGGRGT